MFNLRVSDLPVIVHKDEPNINGTAGIIQNKIVEVLNFFTEDECKNIIKYIEHKQDGWGHVASYGYRLGQYPALDKDLTLFSLSENIFRETTEDVKAYVESFFLKPVLLNSIHVQKLGPGASGSVHSDNTNEDGSSSHFDINKYAAIAYLNENYIGGEVFFPDHGLVLKPKAGSLLIFPGGQENVHGVMEVSSGDRYSMVSFWDFLESKYSAEVESWREAKMQEWSESWLKEWEKDWSFKWKTWNFI